MGLSEITILRQPRRPALPTEPTLPVVGAEDDEDGRPGEEMMESSLGQRRMEPLANAADEAALQEIGRPEEQLKREGTEGAEWRSREEVAGARAAIKEIAGEAVAKRPPSPVSLLMKVWRVEATPPSPRKVRRVSFNLGPAVEEPPHSPAPVAQPAVLPRVSEPPSREGRRQPAELTRNGPEVGTRIPGCWNCGQGGHSWNQCVEQLMRFCRGCGQGGYTEATCPTCGEGWRRKRGYAKRE